MKFICHVFPTRGLLSSHINRELCEDRAVAWDRLRNSYTDATGDKHWCFVIDKTEDVSAFLGMEFFEHHIHGTFDNLTAGDIAFLKHMLKRQTRHAPEVA